MPKQPTYVGKEDMIIVLTSLKMTVETLTSKADVLPRGKQKRVLRRDAKIYEHTRQKLQERFDDGNQKRVSQASLPAR